MKLNVKGIYALRMICHLYLNKDKGFLKLSDISKLEGIPLPYLHKIVKNLVRDGIVKSVKGPNGGYALGDSTKGLMLIDILRSLEVYTDRIDPKEDLETTPAGLIVKEILEDIHFSIMDVLLDRMDDYPEFQTSIRKRK